MRIEMITNWSVPGPVLMVNKKIYEIIGKYDDSLLAEDLQFFLRASAKNLLGFIDTSVGAYRIHGSNTCFNKDNTLALNKTVFKTYLKYIGLFNFKEKLMILRTVFAIFRNILKLLLLKLVKG